MRKGVIAGILQPADVVQAPTADLPPADSCPAVVPSHLQSLYAESTRDLREAEQRDLAELLRAYSDVFSTGPTDLGRTNLVQHDIQTRPGPPVKQQPRRMAFEKQHSADEQIQQNLNVGLASPSNSCWSSPIVMVQKKDQTYRLCVDYRTLNERTIKDAYPLPRIQDTLDTLSTAKWFSTLDLASGYWQVELTPQARQAAAFCSRKGLFAWNVMPFGLCNAPATFQRLMDRVLAGMQWEICLVYLDDIIVLGKDVKEMLQRLAKVFERLRQANLKLKPAKCCLFHRRVVYLGHIVSEHGIATDPEKVRKIREWPQPTGVIEVRQFVGLASYYRRFVKDFASVAKPLHNLLRKHARFHWNSESQQAFDKLKEMLTTAPILGYPMDSGDLILDTDASNFGIGAVLSQLQQGEERVLAYGSRSLTPTEQNYCTTRRELLAVVEFTTHFRQYLLGRSFTVRTDHSSLQWLIRMREPEGQLARWLEKLGEYDFKVVHRPGRCHENADVLSRRPCRSTCPCNLKNPILSSPQLCHQAVQCDFDGKPVNNVPTAVTTESCQVGGSTTCRHCQYFFLLWVDY